MLSGVPVSTVKIVYLWAQTFYRICTFMTKSSSVGWLGTAAGETTGSLHTLTIVLTQGSIAAAVSWAASSYSWCDLRSLLQVQNRTIQLQRADASQEAFLSGRSTSYEETPITYPTLPLHVPQFQKLKGEKNPTNY